MILFNYMYPPWDIFSGHILNVILEHDNGFSLQLNLHSCHILKSKNDHSTIWMFCSCSTSGLILQAMLLDLVWVPQAWLCMPKSSEFAPVKTPPTRTVGLMGPTLHTYVWSSCQLTWKRNKRWMGPHLIPHHSISQFKYKIPLPVLYKSTVAMDSIRITGALEQSVIQVTEVDKVHGSCRCTNSMSNSTFQNDLEVVQWSLLQKRGPRWAHSVGVKVRC